MSCRTQGDMTCRTCFVAALAAANALPCSAMRAACAALWRSAAARAVCSAAFLIM